MLHNLPFLFCYSFSVLFCSVCFIYSLETFFYYLMGLGGESEVSFGRWPGRCDVVTLLPAERQRRRLKNAALGAEKPLLMPSA